MYHINLWLKVAACLIMGYLLGALSPSYLLGKLLRGIDIREYGDKNAGTVNTYRILGLVPAVITATVDVFKGLVAIAVARGIGVPVPFAYASGLLVVMGHVFPFYLNFKGGQGVATATGMLLVSLVFLIKNNWLGWPSLTILGGVVLVFTYVTRKGEVVGSIVLPLLLYMVYTSAPLNVHTIFFGVLVGYILGINIFNIVKRGTFNLKPETKETIKWSRFLLRPVAVVFPIFYLTYGKKTVIILVGAVALFFILVDTVRLLHGKFNVLLFKNLPMVFKTKETTKFSSMTMFLVACFVTILLFEKAIACTVIVFLIFGDLFSKFFGLQYGRIKIFNKTLEGSLTFLSACSIAGYILSNYLDLPVFMLLTGILAATLTEVAPLGVDDNFSVPLISASTMTVFQVF